MTLPQHPGVRSWLGEPLTKDVAAAIDRVAEADDVEHVAVMPDVHLSKDVCVGLAVATYTLLYPQAVGGDIGCGMAAVRFGASADVLSGEESAGRLLAGLYQRIPALRHGRSTMPMALPEALQQTPLSHPSLEKLKSRDGRVQFGTLGRGNHFLEFQQDQDSQLWLMLHSGSRAMGQAITSHHLARATTGRSKSALPFLNADSDGGQAYLSDVAWAIHYAEQNRLAMIRVVVELIEELFQASIDWGSLIHANHNHVRREAHFGSELWVHRKGALPAQEGEAGVIPGSMGTASFHVVGRGCLESLRSSSHGAGRALSRTEAVRTISAKKLLREMQGIWFDQRHVDRLCDEAPSAYKDIYKVMRSQRELTRIVRELRPILSYKEG